MALASTTIKYLAFEGGGGKGTAYLGAIEALEALHILQYNNPNTPLSRVKVAASESDPNGIIGISGASAGAITALLLGCGYSASDIKKEFLSVNFNDFFDLPFYIRDSAGSYRVTGANVPYLGLVKGERTSGATTTAIDVEFKERDSKLTPGTHSAAISGAVPGSEPYWNLWKHNIDDILLNLEPNKTKKDFLDTFYRHIAQYTNTYLLSIKELGLNLLVSIILPFISLKYPSLLPPAPTPSILELLRGLIKKVTPAISLYENLTQTISTLIANLVNNNKELDEQTKNSLTSYTKYYINSLFLDYGVFSGTQIHEQFDLWITRKIDPSFVGNKWVTFSEYWNEFHVDLKFVAVNITTGCIEVLSKNTTPRLCVATAARMSMSLPLIFKPIHITSDAARALELNLLKDIGDKKDINVWEGFWIDGGLFDNAPVRVWGNINQSLLMRLGGRYIHNDISDLTSFFAALATSIANLGSGQLTDTNFPFQDHIVELDIAHTSLLKFDYTDGERNNKAFNPEILATWVENKKRVNKVFTP